VLKRPARPVPSPHEQRGLEPIPVTKGKNTEEPRNRGGQEGRNAHRFRAIPWFSGSVSLVLPVHPSQVTGIGARDPPDKIATLGQTPFGRQQFANRGGTRQPDLPSWRAVKRDECCTQKTPPGGYDPRAA
jgi:hypothetical protein